MVLPSLPPEPPPTLSLRAGIRVAPCTCTQRDTPLILPSEALASMTAYDLDANADASVVESLTVPAYEYFQTPLRASAVPGKYVGVEVGTTVC